MSISIYVFADHPLFQTMLSEYISALPGLLVCGVARYGKESIEQVINLKPNLVIIDLLLRHIDINEIVQELHDRCPQLRIIIHSIHQETSMVSGVLAAGASGYVVKRQPSEIETAIWHVFEGGTYFEGEAG